MSKLTFLLSCFPFFVSVLFAQEISLKYGKITTDELNMKMYSKDTTATAVILYDDGNASYAYLPTIGFKVKLEHKRKIKILKHEGVEEATITIPYYYTCPGDKENIDNLEATAYNLDKGKVVQTKLDKKYIFDEEINSKFRQIKFSIPNVKVGTVFEFKYTQTLFFYDFPDWNIQSDIPVINSNYDVLIPEYFTFNIDIKGFEHVEVNETAVNQDFNFGSDRSAPKEMKFDTDIDKRIEKKEDDIVSATSRSIKYSAKDIPALKDEPYVWCAEDFMSGVRFELKGTKYPYDYYKPYTQSWENLEETLTRKTDFGINLKMSNPYKAEIKALVGSTKDEMKKIELIYSFLKNHIRWDETYSFFGNKAREAVTNGTGNNGQINMVLISTLKDAGIKAYPILINRRNKGRLPYTFPSINKLNTFVVAAQTSDSITYYMDGSAIYGGLNMLPINLLVDRGRVFEEKVTDKWIDFTSIDKSQQVSFLVAQLDKEGSLIGKLSTMYTNQLAYVYKSAFQVAKDSMNYIEKIENSNQITIDSFKIEGKEPMSATVKEEIKFTKKFDASGDYLYINPMIFPHIIKNPFTQSERKLPIEFDYPFIFQLSCTITIPNNYRVEEIPKTSKMILNEKMGKCIYQVFNDGNIIQLNYRFELNQIIFPQNEYTAIRDFYGQVVTKNLEMIVLKKIE